MKTDVLSPGDKIEIRITQLKSTTLTDKLGVGLFFSSVYSVLDDNKIIIIMPIHKGKNLVLRQGIRYEFVFETSTGMYRAQGQALNHYKKDNFFVTKVELSDNLVRHQRREFYRMSCSLPVEFKAMKVTKEEIEPDMATMLMIKYPSEINRGKLEDGTGTALDISGGGIRFVSKSQLEGAAYLVINFPVSYGDDAQEVEMLAQLIETEHKMDDLYQHRIKFINSDNKKVETIVRFIFDEERRIRRRN